MLIESQLQLDSIVLNRATGPPSGRPLVLLHGVTRRWQTFLPVVPSLAVRSQLHVLDFRGHGASTAAANGYLVTDYVNDALALIRELNEPAIVYGHSLGAMVAAGVAAEVPDRVRAVILEDPPLNSLGPRITESVFHGFFADMQKFAGDQRDTVAIAHELAEVILRDPETGAQWRLGAMRDGPALRFMASSLRQLAPEVLTPIVEGRWLDGYDVDSVFRRIQCPALLIQADTSAGGMLTDDDASRVESLSRDLTRTKLSGVGHMVHWTHTQQLTNLVVGFIESL